jgi:exodeoxyribonuclease VII small subunit
MIEQTNTYAESYAILEAINKKLQNGQNNANLIDELAPMIAEATKSYQLCSERIKAAEKVLEEHNKSD